MNILNLMKYYYKKFYENKINNNYIKKENIKIEAEKGVNVSILGKPGKSAIGIK